MESNSQKKFALVMSGGGARGAYEAGVLHYIRSEALKDSTFARQFSVYCGSSVGAINASFMAATAHNLKYQARRCYEIWTTLKQENVYKRDVGTLAALMGRSFTSIVKNLFKSSAAIEEPDQNQQHFRGFFNTAPLLKFIQDVVPWKQISVNMNHGLLDSLCITTTQVATGNLELFIEKRPEIAYTGKHIHHNTKIEYIHALASGALPLVFPTVKIGHHYYMDGSLRLNTPMSPAIQLHADKILVIGAHNPIEGTSEDKVAQRAFYRYDPPPSLGSVFGKVMNAMFFDKIDYDMEQMERINRIIEWGEECYGPEFLDRINTHTRSLDAKGDIASRGLKKLEALEIYPSISLQEIFYDTIQKVSFFQNELTSFERTLLKFLDVDLNSGKDFLSYIMFYPEYLQKMVELGFEDAKAQRDKIGNFFAT